MGRVIRRYASQVKIGYCIAGCVSRTRIVGAWINPTLLSYIGNDNPLGSHQRGLSLLHSLSRQAGVSLLVYLVWQLKQTLLPLLSTRRNIGRKSLPTPAEGTPCGSWQDAHSTLASNPV